MDTYNITLLYLVLCPTPPDGTYTKAVSDAEVFLAGTIYDYECSSSFIPHGEFGLPGAMQSTCLDTRQWSLIDLPICTGL